MFSCLDSIPDIFDRGRPDAMLFGGSMLYLLDCLRVWMFKSVAVLVVDVRVFDM